MFQGPIRSHVGRKPRYNALKPSWRTVCIIFYRLISNRKKNMFAEVTSNRILSSHFQSFLNSSLTKLVLKTLLFYL